VTHRHALFAAAAAAWLLPSGRPGVGVVIVALLVAFAAAGPRRPTFVGALLAALAVALCAVSALRDAQWVVLASLAAAVVLASAAAAAGETWSRVAAGSVAVVLRLADAPAEARAFGAPEIERVRRLAPAVRGACVGVVVVVPFGVLFWTADGAFAQLGSSVPHPPLDAVPRRVLAFVLVLALVVGLVLARRRPPTWEVGSTERRATFVEWAIPLALLDALFLAFVVVQVAVLFGGNDRVLHTAGLTYAEYARQGFGQLLAAASLTLLVVAGATRYAGVTTRRDRIVLRALLGVLCLLTLVVLASALRRLGLYEDAYGFTRLRLAAHGLDLWLAMLFVLLLAAGMARHARWLPRTALVATGATLLVFALANPDRMIAERNVARWDATGRIDVAYLRSLSADAVPALERLPPGLRAQALASVRERLATREPWSSANLARARARESLDRERPGLR
jgi:Domain of unknown function (DUF4173)